MSLGLHVYLSLVVLYNSTPLHAQRLIEYSPKDSIDSVLFRVEYHVLYRQAMEDVSLSEDLHGLYIGNHTSVCMSNATLFTTEMIPAELIEAAQKKTLTYEQKQQLVAFNRDREKYEPFDYMIYKNYPVDGMLGCYQYIGAKGAFFNDGKDFLYYTESTPIIPWTLEDGDSIVCEYPCKKASAEFRGRLWTVWYAPDIPCQDGPWKLCGLPGLILKAADESGDFLFEAFEIGQPKPLPQYSHQTIQKPSSKYNKSTLQKIKKLLALGYINAEGQMRLLHGNAELDQILQKGGKIDKRKRTPCMIEME